MKINCILENCSQSNWSIGVCAMNKIFVGLEYFELE